MAKPEFEPRSVQNDSQGTITRGRTDLESVGSTFVKEAALQTFPYTDVGPTVGRGAEPSG